MKNNSITRSLCLCAAVLGLSISTSQAANVQKLDTTSMVTNAVNWSAVASKTDVGEFGSTPQVATLANMTLGGNIQLGGLQFDANMQGPLTIATGANILFLGSSGIVANTNATFGNLIALTNSQTWKVATTLTNTFNGVISGPSSSFLTLNGGGYNGTVTFGTQANTYSGGTLINGGIVNMGTAASLGTGALTNNGAILVFPHTGFSPSVNFVISNTCVVDFNSYAGNDNVNGAWAGGGTVTISNLQSFASTFTIGGGSSSATMNNFSGKIIIAPVSGAGSLPAEGTVRFNSAGTSYNVGSPNMSIDLGPVPSAVTLITRNSPATTSLGELKGGADSSLIGSRSSNGVDTWVIGGLNTSTTFAGQMTNSTGGVTIVPLHFAGGVFALTKVGSGTLTLTGTNYYTGNTTFSGGYLNAGSIECVYPYTNVDFMWGAPDAPTVSGGSPSVRAWYGGPFGCPTNWGDGNPSNLTQNMFIFNGGTLQYSAVNHADYSGRFATNGSQKISIDVNGQNVTFATPIQGANTSLTNMDTAGGGSLTLTAQEYNTGPTVVASGGVLKLSGSGALTSGTTLSIQPGGTFDVSALSSPYTVAVTVAGNGTGTGSSTAATIKPASGGIFDFNTQPITVTWGGALAGTDSTHPALVASQGTLNFSGNTIDVIVPGAPSQFLSPGTYTLITAPAITGTPSATPSYAGGNGLGFAETGTISVVGGNTVVLTVVQNAVETWTDALANQLWNAGGNWLSGTPPQNAGDLANFGTAANPAITLNQNETMGGALFTNVNSYTISGANTLTLDNSGNGATLEVLGGTANQIASAVSLNDNLTTVVFPNQSLNLSGVVANTAGAKTLTVAGGGTNIIGNANTYGPAAGTTGTTLSGGGTLQVGNNSALGAGDLAISGGAGTLQSGGAGLSLANNIGVASGLTLTANNNGNTFTLGGVLGGSGGLATVGLGTVSLTGVDTITGPIAINGGVLTIGGAGVLDGAGVVAGGGTNAANIADATLLDYASSANEILSGVISGAGGLQMDGSGVLALQGGNTFTGNVVINSGTVSVQSVQNNNSPTASSLGNPQISKTVTINSGGTLSIDQNNVFGNGTSPDSINFIINGGFMRVTNSNSSIGPVSFMGTGGLMDETVAASLTTQYGGFEFSGGIGVGGHGTSTINSTVGGYYNLTVNTLLPYGIIYVTNSDAILNVNAKLANSGGSQGVAGLLKDGAGTLNLSAANAYTGDTIVSNGTLALVTSGTISTSTHVIVLSGATLDLSTASTPTLAFGQTLSGNGTVNGLVTSAGTISPAPLLAAPARLER